MISPYSLFTEDQMERIPYQDLERIVKIMWDEGIGEFYRLPGSCLVEWTDLVESDYNDIDRIYIDLETIGGE